MHELNPKVKKIRARITSSGDVELQDSDRHLLAEKHGQEVEIHIVREADDEVNAIMRMQSLEYEIVALGLASEGTLQIQ